MPPEYYLGIAIAAILVVLSGVFLQRWLGTRFVVLHKSSGTDQLANQLSRIADSLEKIVVHLGASPPTEKLPVDEPPVVEKPPVEEPPVEEPPVEKPSIPLRGAPQQSEADLGAAKVDQPADRHVSLSMFGR